MFLTITFYHFVALKSIPSLQAHILQFCEDHEIKGTILLADEGINGTISGKEDNIRHFLNFIKKNEVFSALEYKESWVKNNPFYRMKVRLKKEIVALGVKGISPTKKVGIYVKPEDWNALISDPDTLVIMRWILVPLNMPLTQRPKHSGNYPSMSMLT